VRALGAALALLAALAAPVAARSTATGIVATTVVSGLREPTALAILPDERLVVLEKNGTVRLWIPTGGLLPSPILTLPTCTVSEMGLLGVVADPAFASNGYLYLYVTNPPGGDPRRCAEGSAAGRRNRVVRVTLAGDTIDPSSLVVLLDGLRTDNTNHDGGGLRIGADGALYVGVGDTGIGDGGSPGASTNPYAHDLASPEGKILRLALDGSPAPGNPFLGTGGAADFVYAYGLRNPFRFDFDPQTGLLWVGDVGQNTFEEIDVVEAGDDLGWPGCEAREPANECPGNSVPPVYVYSHEGDDASVTGGTFDAGGAYVFADFVFDLIWRLGLTADRRDVVGPPEVLVRNAGGPADFQRGPDGAVWYVGYLAGEVVRLSAGDGTPSAECTAAVGRVASVAMSRAARGLMRCSRRGERVCELHRTTPRRLRRRLARACRTPPPAATCGSLQCVTCGTADALTDCVAVGGAGLASTILTQTQGDGRCERATARAMLRATSARLRTGVATPLRGLRRACRTPSADSCRVFGCTTCASGDDLGQCVARFVDEIVKPFGADPG
jgi:glucose/arabinose dehydrogenase